ncbi:hypothetical protein [Streptomyces sp. Tu6071]|uniref:hypothetical protein n=1 Tax=Streptomyces sp. Tu6071 TaxID=355249 RepID=UPI00069A6A8F|nr:hypothetical protein [Streptomyces sp. Tu6071]
MTREEGTGAAPSEAKGAVLSGGAAGAWRDGMPGSAEALRTLLVCAAADPGLGGLLLLDPPPGLLPVVTTVLRDLLGDGAGPAPVVHLGAGARDADLWTRLSAGPGGEGTPLLAPGALLSAELAPGPPPLVVVPELSRLSTAGLRAALQFLGSEDTVVERPGLRLRLRPRACWLACCSTEDAAQLSAHLLDRFPLRCAARALRSVTPTALAGHGTRVPGRGRALPDPARVPLDEAALARIVELGGERATGRRLLALGRLARGLARLDGDPAAGRAHAERAAAVLGLHAPLPSAPVPAESAPRRDPAGEPASGPTPPVAGNTPGPVERVSRPSPPRAIGTAPVEAERAAEAPYPEDTEQPTAARTALGPRARTEPGGEHGAVIGTRRARTVREVAPVPTVVEAARLAALRGTAGWLRIDPADLRAYVRAPVPERLLVLLLDHTARPGGDWSASLRPFLDWAYSERAGLCVVEAGAAGAAHELRAEVFAARRVLDPRLAAALRRPAGRATPLPHALSLAAAELRHAFGQYGGRLVEAWLVVASDGRANVPLDSSLSGRFPPVPVGDRAVRDSLAQAARLTALDRTRLRVTLLVPGNAAALTPAFAEALRAERLALPAPAAPAGAGNAPGSAGAAGEEAW